MEINVVVDNARVYFYEGDVYAFCGGLQLGNLSTCSMTEKEREKEKKQGTAEYGSLLECLTSRYTSGFALFMNDVRGGCWDNLLFSKLPQGPLRVGDVEYRFVLSDWFCNPNTSNECRSLIITVHPDYMPAPDDVDEWADDDGDY